MPQGKTIHFVTWPDGKVDQASINIYSEGRAKIGLIAEWLPERFFGKLKWLSENSYVLDQMWRDMAEKGFKVHSIDVPVEDATHVA